MQLETRWNCKTHEARCLINATAQSMRRLYLCSTLLDIFIPEGLDQMRLEAEVILEWLYFERQFVY